VFQGQGHFFCKRTSRKRVKPLLGRCPALACPQAISGATELGSLSRCALCQAEEQFRKRIEGKINYDKARTSRIMSHFQQVGRRASLSYDSKALCWVV